MMYIDLIILGGGAAGLMAACTAGHTVQTLLLEKNDRVGRKLLTTGNGRCNLSNLHQDICHYHSQSPDYVAQILARRTLGDTLAFFKQIGLQTVAEDSRLYPASQTAASVLDVLRLEAERVGVQTQTGCVVTSVFFNPRTRSYVIDNNQGQAYTTRALIVALGGKAAPQTGSDGTGFAMLAQLGHPLNTVFPALTPLVMEHPGLKALQGIRLKPCRLAVLVNGRVLAADTGEIQFTAYGLSGIPAMQVSGALYNRKGVTAALDLWPDYTADEVLPYLLERRTLMASLPAEHYFTGLFHKRVGHALLKQAGIDWQKKLIGDLSDRQIGVLAGTIKAWPFPVTGVKGFANAQVTGGGALLTQFDPDTMQSKVKPGLFAAGEVLDVYGDCGGYNLHWAWTTGYLAGAGAARYVRGVKRG